MRSQLNVVKPRSAVTHVVYKHVSVIGVLVVLWISGDDEFMASTDGPLIDTVNPLHPYPQVIDVHLCYPSSDRYVFQDLSVNCIVFLAWVYLTGGKHPNTYSIQSNCHGTSMWVS